MLCLFVQLSSPLSSAVVDTFTSRLVPLAVSSWHHLEPLSSLTAAVQQYGSGNLVSDDLVETPFHPDGYDNDEEENETILTPSDQMWFESQVWSVPSPDTEGRDNSVCFLYPLIKKKIKSITI